MRLTLKAVRNEKLRRERGSNSRSGFALAIDVPGRPAGENPDEWLYHPIETSVAAHHGLLMRTAERAITTPHGRATHRREGGARLD
jgi:hypothetical protein